MNPKSFGRDRRIANVVILFAILALVVTNVLYAFEVPYMPIRFLVVVAAAVAIFSTVLWIVARYRPDGRLLSVLVMASVMFGISLLLQVDLFSESVAKTTGLSTAAVQHVLEDSLAEVALGLVIIVTVSIFVTAASTTYIAQQRAEELEATQTAWLESEERFRRAFADGPIGMMFVDRGFNIVSVNHVLCDMLGYFEEELIGKSIESVTHPADVDRTIAMVETIFKDDIPRKSFENRFRKKDRSFFWGRLTASVIRDGHGSPLYGFGMIENITERKRMEDALRGEQRFLQNLLNLQERERRFIAYEIHDGVVQQTVAAMMYLESYLVKSASTPGPQTELLRLAIDSLREAVNEGRRMIGELRPMIIDERGIVAAIDYLVNDEMGKEILSVEFVHDVRFRRLDQLLESTIFRITQEALANARRHSKSDKVLVKLNHTDDKIHLEIRDWGIGFDPAGIDTSRFGVKGLIERARLFGGNAIIDSKPGEGTRVRVELPIIYANDTSRALTA